MAGIGFELRRMIDEREGLLARTRAYICAGLISSGPWIMTILTLSIINSFGPYFGGKQGYETFRSLVTYAFAFSLILIGLLQMAVTRQVADLLYSKQYDKILPAFVATLTLVAVIATVLGIPFCVLVGFRPSMTFATVSLFAIITMTWVTLIWLSAVREFDEVLRAYVYGTLMSLVSLLLVGLYEGSFGLMASYALGQALTLLLLIRTVLRGMESHGKRDWTILKSVRTYPALVGIGFFYNAAIWIDKMIFWFMDGTGPHPWIRFHPLYDTSCYLAYLTVVPALAVNLVWLETSFYEHYRAYYGSILGGTPYKIVEDRRRRMVENLRESSIRLLRVQGAITLFFVIFAPFVINALEIPPTAVRIFRLACIGAFFHVLLLITVLVQLYFDLRRRAWVTTLTFLLMNGTLAVWSVKQGLGTYGVGYALSSFVAFVLGYVLLTRSLVHLNYLTFANQALGSRTKGEGIHLETGGKTEKASAQAKQEVPVQAEEKAQEQAQAQAEATPPPLELIALQRRTDDLPATRLRNEGPALREVKCLQLESGEMRAPETDNLPAVVQRESVRKESPPKESTPNSRRKRKRRKKSKSKQPSTPTAAGAVVVEQLEVVVEPHAWNVAAERTSTEPFVRPTPSSNEKVVADVEPIIVASDEVEPQVKPEESPSLLGEGEDPEILVFPQDSSSLADSKVNRKDPEPH